MAAEAASVIEKKRHTQPVLGNRLHDQLESNPEPLNVEP